MRPVVIAFSIVGVILCLLGLGFGITTRSMIPPVAENLPPSKVTFVEFVGSEIDFHQVKTLGGVGWSGPDLIVTVRVRNTHPTKNLEFRTCGHKADPVDKATLIDQFANPYSQVAWGVFDTPALEPTATTVFANHVYTFKLTFERPAPHSSDLTLTIPGACIGEREPFVFPFKAPVYVSPSDKPKPPNPEPKSPPEPAPKAKTKGRPKPP